MRYLSVQNVNPQFQHLQCKHDQVTFPFQWAGKYANLKKLFQSAYKPKSKMRLEQMLEHLGMEFEGRLHRFVVVYSDHFNLEPTFLVTLGQYKLKNMV